MNSGILFHIHLFRKIILLHRVESLLIERCRFVGPKFEYRSADGSWNNPTIPWLGAANTEYARSTAPLTIQPSGLPDAGTVFDSIMAREKFTPHPNKVSSVFFAWASLIIHGKLSNVETQFFG